MRSATERAVCWPSGAPGRLWRWPLLWPIGGQCSSALYTGLFDHSSIYLLIAGSYTPFTLILLDGTWKGPVICGVVWAAALLGVTLNAVSVERFEKFSMLLYIAMGWAVVFAVGDVVRALPSAGFWLLLLGGVSYTGGIVFYAWHKKGRVHYMHGVWHLFVLLGSVLHYLCILLYVLPRAYA